MNKQPAFFIDRDGVIIRMVYYQNKGQFDSPQSPKDVKLVEGITDIIRWVNKKGILAVEISNQPGVAKGKMNKKTSDAIETRTHELLKKKEAKIDKAYICFHHPKGIVPNLTKKCQCRKPEPGLFLQASKELNIDLQKSVFLGDKASDVEVGKKIGCKNVILLHNEDLPEKVEAAKKAKADFKINSPIEIMGILKNIFGKEV